MDADQTTELLPQLLEARYAGRYRRALLGEVPEGMQDPGGWVIEDDGAFCFVRVSRATNPFIWLKCGIAHAIPKSSDLAYYVARANKDLVVGRAYLAAGDEVAMVVLDETIFAQMLAWGHDPSMQDLVNRFETALAHARTLQQEVLARFGGRPFAFDDWSLLVF